MNETKVKEADILYKGYTITTDYQGGWYERIMFYPTEQGIDHDADMDENGYHYCGNCQWVDSIDEAKDAIDEKIMMAMPPHLVVTKGKFVVLGKEQVNITKFWSISDAIKFAVKFKGELLTPIKSI
jgi:hypothetical protein